MARRASTQERSIKPDRYGNGRSQTQPAEWIDNPDAGELLAGIEILVEQLRSFGLLGCSDDQRIPK
jgi:hypothetical protein